MFTKETLILVRFALAVFKIHGGQKSEMHPEWPQTESEHLTVKVPYIVYAQNTYPPEV